MLGLSQDVRYAARRLRRSPGFTAVAGLTLALGMAASAAIFSVADALMLEPLRYAEPGRRVMIWSCWKRFDKTWVNLAEMNAYRERCPSLAQVAYWQTDPVNLTGEDVRWHGRSEKQLWRLEDQGARYALGARYKF